MKVSLVRWWTAAALAAPAAGCGALEPAEESTTIGSSAAGLTAADRCQFGYAADYSETVNHPGGQVGTSFPSDSDPQNFIFPGDVVRVTVTGSVRYDLWGSSAGPGGNGLVANNSFPFPGLGQIASVARWNNNPGGWVGSPMQTTWL